MKIGKVISSIIKTIAGGNWTLVKSQISGRDDIQETPQAVPFGIDSRPIKDIKAVYSPTENNAEPVLIGYFMEVAEAEAGELKTFSTNDSGEIQAFVFHKKDGNLELNGNLDNAVRYQKLDDAISVFKQSIDSSQSNQTTKINLELGKIQTAIVALGGTYNYIPVTADAVNYDLSAAKIDNIKTP